MSYWWIDAILIAIIVIYALIGLSKGFFESVLRLVSTAIAVGLAVWLARPASTLVNGVLPLIKWYKQALSSQPDPLNIFGQQLTHAQAAGFLSVVTTGIVIFILVKVIIWILAKIFDSSTKNNTALSGLNRLLGLAFGLAKACVIIAAALGTISMLSSLPAMQKAEEAVQGTKVTGWVYKYVDTFVSDNLKKIDLKEILNKVLESAKETDTTTPEEGASESSSAVVSYGTTESGDTYYVTLD